MTVTEPCTACDRGWRTVGPGYVEQHAPWPAPPELGATPEQVAYYELAMVRCELRRKTLAETIYPCKTCNPRLFFRWAKGCLKPGHNATDCDLCDTPGRRVGRSQLRDWQAEAEARHDPTPEPVGAPPIDQAF